MCQRHRELAAGLHRVIQSAADGRPDMGLVWADDMVVDGSCALTVHLVLLPVDYADHPQSVFIGKPAVEQHGLPAIQQYVDMANVTPPVLQLLAACYACSPHRRCLCNEGNRGVRVGGSCGAYGRKAVRAQQVGPANCPKRLRLIHGLR